MMKRLSMIIMLLAVVLHGMAATATKEEADKDYQENRYAEAIEKYESILADQGVSADIYYNLGNSYYKSKNIAKAVLNYERASLLNPGDADIRFNLEMARSKTVDQVTPASEVFIVTWIRSLTELAGERGWGVAGIASFIIMLAGIALYMFTKRVILKKAGFSIALVCLVLVVCSNIFASEQKDKLMERNGAIVMSPSITVKSTPNESGTDLFVLHEGTKVYVDDNSMKAWKEIRLEDGKTGWIPAEAIEQI